MNIPIFIVAVISTLAVFGHVFGGTRDTASIAPTKEDKKLTRNWKQAMGAFQMLAVDLLLVTIALFVIALTDVIPFEHELTLFLSLLYFLWGLVWLIQMLWLKSEIKTYLNLPHWVLWFVCSGLLYYGAISH
jgi:uncharacterized protein YhhL (DUF1145 family)